MKNITAKARLKRASELYDRAIALPKLLIENDQEYQYGDKNTEDGNQSRLQKRLIVQDLMLEVRSFIKLSYSNDSEYFGWLHKITFTQEEKGFTSTYLDGINGEWRKGRAELISLLTNIVSEEKEAENIEKFMVDKTLPLRYGGFGIAVLISLVTIWLAPENVLSNIFNSSGLFPVRILLSIGIGLLLLILIAKDNWKELLLTGIVTVSGAIFPFLKTDQTQQPTVQQVDTTQKAELRPHAVLKDPAKKPAPDTTGRP